MPKKYTKEVNTLAEMYLLRVAQRKRLEFIVSISDRHRKKLQNVEYLKSIQYEELRKLVPNDDDFQALLLAHYKKQE